MENIKIMIRLANITDLDGIMELIYQKCLWLKNNNITQWDIEVYPYKYDKNYFINIMKTEKLFVAVDNKLIIGMILIKQQDIDYWKINDNKAFYLRHFASSEKYKGLGKQIIDFCIKYALDNDKDYLRLDCRTDNLKLNEYYSNLGFELKGHGQIDTYCYNIRELKLKR